MQLSYFDQAFAQPTIYDPIFACLPPPTIVRCGRTCVKIYLATKEFTARAYNINRHLSRSFKNPQGFRSPQAQTGSLISGSNALQFFDRTYYADSDFDVFVPPDTVRDIGRWLINHEGYIFAPRPDQSPQFENAALQVSSSGPDHEDGLSGDHEEYRSTDITGVHSFAKAPDLTIQIITTQRSPMDCILNFHSTCVMNLIAFDAAYSLYPRATFDSRLGLSLGKISPREVKALVKYTTPEALRRMGDRDSWVILLDTTNVELRSPLTLSSPPFKEDPAAFSSWVLSERTPRNYRTMYHTLRPTVFKYQYVTADSAFLDIMTPFFKRQGSVEHSKLRGLPESDKVEALTWWDGALQGFYEAHLKRLEDARMKEG